MNRRVLSFLFLAALMATLAAGQTVYGPPGISPFIPLAPPPSGPVVTPPAATIPITSSTNTLPTSSPLTTIPVVPAVAPPIEPSPTERYERAEKSVYLSSGATGSAAGSFFNPGVSDSAPKVDDGSHGRSLGEAARAVRRCTPNVAGRTFTNDDFESMSGSASDIPTLMKQVCKE